MDPFQKGFAALATGYFDLFSKGRTRKWLSYASDTLAKGSMGVELPEYDPNYRFRIHEASVRTKRAAPPPSLRDGERVFMYATVPLLKPQHNIRLVTVQPGKNQSPIECVLRTVDLGDNLSYEALSYTWGDPTANCAIIVNGGRFLVAKNLYDFLKNIRHASTPLTFWIDGICINQADIDERASQVQLMRDVYARAPRVRVWLGDETKSTTPAFALATALASVGVQKGAGVISPEELEDDIRGQLAGQPPNWRALDEIFWNPWFNRTWIIQELALAQTVEVQSGNHKISWDSLVAAGELLTKHHLISALDIDPSPVTALQTYRDAAIKSQRLNLLDLMHNSRSNWCTDSRDKVYGLLGLAADVSALTVEPNYNRSVEDAFISIAVSIMKKDNNLDFLSAIEDYKWRVHSKLPSWIPDWTAHPRSTPFLSRPHLWSFFAAGDSLAQVTYHADRKCLRVRGKILDTITRVGSADVPLRDGIPGIRETSYFRQTLVLGAVAQRQHWENLVNDIESYPTGESPMDAFHHTAIAEGNLASGYSPQEVPELYAAWKEHWKYLLNYRLTDLPEHATPVDLKNRERATVYTQAWKEAFRFRRLIITKTGYLGLTSYSARPDDLLCLLYGGKTVYIIRKKKSGQHQFICEAYVRGLMQSQGIAGDMGVETDFELI